MIRFYTGSGAGDFSKDGQPLSADEWQRIRGAAVRLLSDRNHDQAAQFLDSIPFDLFDGRNHFGDEFQVLFCSVPHERYVELSELAAEADTRSAFRAIANTLGEIGYQLRHIGVGLDTDSGPAPVPSPSPKTTSEVVDRALADAERLISSRGGAISAVDRAHTAFHGYLRDICRDASIPFAEDAGITALFGLIRQQHAAFTGTTSSGEPVHKLLRPMASIIDALDPVRNQRSMAHPNPVLLDEPEAMLTVNAIRTLLHYISSKLQGQRSSLPF